MIAQPYVEIHRNLLYLANQPFYVDAASPALDPASDFAQGVKTGPVDYDQRLNAFFIANDDHSAGEGYDVVNAREDTGVFSHSPLGVDGRRSKHLVAPPLMLKLRQLRGTTGYTVANQNRNPITGGGLCAFFDADDVLDVFFPDYAMATSTGYSWRRVAYAGNPETKNLQKLTQVFNIGATWVAVFQCNEVIAGTVPTCVAVTGTVWNTLTAGEPQQRWDTIYYNGSYYSLINTQIRVGAAFADDGADTLFGVLPPGRGQWFGPMLGPNGKTDLYFTKAGRLFFAEAVGQTITEVQLGPGFIVAGGCFFDGNLIVMDGQTIVAYSSDGSSEIIRDIGFQNFRFATPDTEGGLVRAVTADELNLYVGLQHDTAVGGGHDNELHILAYNGRGWHPFAAIPDFWILNMGIGWVPPTGWPITFRGLLLAGIRGNGALGDIIRARAAGNYTAWTGTFADIDDVIPDDGTTVVAGLTDGDRETFGHTSTIAVPTGKVITGVRHVFRYASSSGGSSVDAKPSFRIAATDYDGTLFASSAAAYVWGSQLYTVNPATGVAWVAGDFTGLEFGFKRDATNSGAFSMRVTISFLVVYYGDDGTSEDGVLELQGMLLPPAGSVPAIERDHFSYTWDLYEGWIDGGFIDLRGTLYELMASGVFSSTEKVTVNYSIDDDETEFLLGTITESGQILEWGPIKEGVSFRNYRLHFVGYGSAPDEGLSDPDVADTTVNMGDATARTRIAQSFKLDSAQAVEFVQLFMGANGSPTDNVSITIEADSGGSPSGTALATSALTNGAYFDTWSWHTFKFNSLVQLSAATTYWLVVRRSGAVDAGNYYQLRSDGSAPTYADGEAKSYNPAVWSALNSDLIFKVIPDRTKTADLRGYVVEYIKRPKFRLQGQFAIDVVGMITDKVPVDGETPTFERIYNKLIELWNYETLIPYRLGKIRSGLCQLVTMPVTIENAVGEEADDEDTQTQGTVIIQLLEPKPMRTSSIS